MTSPRPFRLLLLAGLALGALAPAGCGGKKPPPGPPPIQPYPDFFSAYAADEIFVFASLAEKQKFDIDPATASYQEYVNRVGTRVFISDAKPELVPRLVLGYEQANDTELLPANSLKAPPVRSAPPVTTRRSFPAPPTAPELPTQPGAAAATAPALDTGRPPQERLPTGEPDDGLPRTRPVTRDTAAPNGKPSVAVPGPLPATRPGTRPATRPAETPGD